MHFTCYSSWNVHFHDKNRVWVISELRGGKLQGRSERYALIGQYLGCRLAVYPLVIKLPCRRIAAQSVFSMESFSDTVARCTVVWKTMPNSLRTGHASDVSLSYYSYPVMTFTGVKSWVFFRFFSEVRDQWLRWWCTLCPVTWSFTMVTELTACCYAYCTGTENVTV